MVLLSSFTSSIKNVHFLLYYKVILGICECMMLFWNAVEFYNNFVVLHLWLEMHCSGSVCINAVENPQTQGKQRKKEKKHWNFFSDLQGFAAIIVKCYQMSRGGGYLILELCFA